MKFNSDGRSLLSGGNDHLAQLWDVAAGKPQGSPLTHNHDVVVAAFSPDGRSLFTACVSRLGFDAAVWDLNAGRKRLDLHPPRPILKAAFCDQGRAILLGDDKGNLQLHDAFSGERIGPPLNQAGAIRSLDFGPNERTLLVGSDGGAVLWDWRARRKLKKLSFGPDAAEAYFYPDQSGLVLVQNGFAQVWDRNGDARKASPIFRAEGGICELAFSFDSRSVLIRDREGGARLWDIFTGKRIGPAPGRTGITHLAFSPDSRHLAVSGKYGGIALWETSQSMQGSAERIRLWAETVAGMELDSQQVIHLLDPDEVRRRRTRLNELGGPPEKD